MKLHTEEIVSFKGGSVAETVIAGNRRCRTAQKRDVIRVVEEEIRTVFYPFKKRAFEIICRIPSDVRDLRTDGWIKTPDIRIYY